MRLKIGKSLKCDRAGGVDRERCVSALRQGLMVGVDNGWELIRVESNRLLYCVLLSASSVRNKFEGYQVAKYQRTWSIHGVMGKR